MWIKICGITDVRTAERVATLQPDAVGLNFYEPSPRVVAVETAEEIVRSLPEGVTAVGVFVNHAPAEVAAVARRCGLTTVQLHGDEPPDRLAQLQQTEPDLRIIRAWRLGTDDPGRLNEYLGRCRQLGVNLTACLIDARVAGVYGGSGRQVDWNRLAEEYDRDHGPALILAGGLRPDNVADAVKTVRPWGVDTASGVERAPGDKDLRQVERFLHAARAAFQANGVYWPSG